MVWAMSITTFNRQQARCLLLGEWKQGQGGRQLKTKNNKWLLHMTTQINVKGVRLCQKYQLKRILFESIFVEFPKAQIYGDP